MSLRASLAMYDQLPALRAANDRFWQGVAERLKLAGVDAPASLDRSLSHDAVWRQPDLLLAQTCGYPYIRLLKGRVRLVATPVYAFAGGRGTERASFVIVRSDRRAKGIADLRGARAAVNDHVSNSGMNLFRALVAPHAKDGVFFDSVVYTGGHMNSIACVREGRADVAAIDSVTWGLIALHAPGMLEGLRILCETPSGPGLPYISRIDASDAEVAALRAALAETIADPACADATSALGLKGIEILGDADYERLNALRQEAERLGYPIIA